MLTDHIISEICNSMIEDVILIGQHYLTRLQTLVHDKFAYNG